MQGLLAKYGLAAHLAILAVAPLFLFPFVEGQAIAVTLLWLSLVGWFWILLSPSVRTGEMLHQARQRVARGIVTDPLFWVMLVLAVIAGVRAFNGGVKLAYDAEAAVWFMHEPQFPILPASVDGSGFLPFAGVVALLTLVTAARHALGRSARMSLFFQTSMWSGLVGILLAFLLNQRLCGLHELTRMNAAAPTYLGGVFGIYMLAGLAALTYALEHQWLRVLPLFIPAIAGSAVGLWIMSPPYVILSYGGASLLMMVLSFLFTCLVLRGSNEFKYFITVVVALAFAAAVLFMVAPRGIVDARVAAFCDWTLFPEGFESTRKVLSDISVRAWISHLWVGTGLGSFPIDIRFNAHVDEWLNIPPGTVGVANGWLQLLVERGVVGAAMYALPMVILLFFYGCRTIGGVRARRVPSPTVLIGPIALAAALATTNFDYSYLRIEMLVALGLTMALSAASFPKEKN